MQQKDKEKLYVVSWITDDETCVTSGFQVEAIRHDEIKNYGGIALAVVVREALHGDLHRYPVECNQNELDICLEAKWHELSDVPFDEADTASGLVLAEDWWGFPKGTDREDIWHVFDKFYSKGVASLIGFTN